MLNTEINNYNGYNISSIGNVKGAVSAPQNKTANFKGNVSAPLEKDTVEISTKNKKKLSKKQKWAIGVGSVLGLAAAGIAITHHKHSTISKLYKEKLILSNLPEKIEFKEAKTAEEGIKFAKEILGIKEVDKAFLESVDAINVANRGLVDIANANKGKCFLPPKLHYQEMKNGDIAFVVNDIESEYFGHMFINKNYFDEAFLTKKLDKFFNIREFAPKEEVLTKDIKTSATPKKRTRKIYANYHPETLALKERYIESADNLTVMEKRKLYGDYKNALDEWGGFFERYPLRFLKLHKDLFEKANIKYDLEELSKLKKEEQTKKLEEFCELYEKNTGKVLSFKPSLYNQEETIWHELGHLQDFAKNLKELDLKKYAKGTKEYWKNIFKKDAMEKVNARKSVKEIDNRWGSIWDDEFQKLFDENPEEFKKLYPEFYEFITNKEIQETAGWVSNYAQSGIGEFIAETYKKMIKAKKEGWKLPEDVVNLYRKYNGSELPA